ncbi:MAG: hypothetical protein WD066_20325 [Planctomycetaceae bacterium]
MYAMKQVIRYVEGDSDEPLTRGEFNEALQSMHAAIRQLGDRMDRRIDELFEFDCSSTSTPPSTTAL